MNPQNPEVKRGPGRPRKDEYIHPNMAHLIPHRLTAEGVAEFNEGKEPARVQITSDALDKQIQQRRDVLESNQSLQSWEAPDPRRELADRHIKPGMRARFLSPRKIDESGFRGWEPVIDGEGKQVKLGNMLLAQMPEAKAEQRNAHFREQAKEKLRQANDEVKEQKDRLLRETGASPRLSSPGASGEVGLQQLRGNSTTVETFLEGD
jgi:hypothetical protein